MNWNTKTATTAAQVGLTKPLVEGWRYRVIGLTALIFGVGGGLLSLRMGGNAGNNVTYSLGLAMLMPAYFTIPRTKTQRMWQGSLAGILGGLIVMAVLLIFATGTFWPLHTEMLVAFGGYVPGVIAWSWVMTWVTGKTDIKRQQLEERRAQRALETAKETAQAAAKGGFQYDANGKRVHTHRYNRKPGKR